MNCTSNKRAGFFMLEMLCALALFSMISAALAHAYNTIIQCQTHTWNRHYACSLARTVIEKVRIGEWPIGFSQHEQYEIMVTIVPYKSDSIKTYNQIIASVSWYEKNAKEKKAVVVSAGMIGNE